MIGLMYLVVGAIYLLVLVLATRAAYRWAVHKGLSKSKRFLATAVGFLIVYLPVFWDHIPTLVMHKYYCEREAGFWVYKTLEQWKTENPGVMEGLIAKENGLFKHETFDNGHGKSDTYYLNERFHWVVTQQDVSRLLPIIRTERFVTDSQRNTVLARYVDFGSGNSVKNTIGPPGPWKFWLSNRFCRNGEDRAKASAQLFWEFRGREK